MMPLYDLITVIVTILLMVVSMQPPVVGLIQQGIQSIDLSQFEPVQALLKSGGDLATSTATIDTLLQQDAVVHPLALVFSLIFALYLNKFVQMGLIQIHLLVYEFSPMTVLWIVIENAWNFLYVTAFPWAIGWFTFQLFNSLLTSYCIDSMSNANSSSGSSSTSDLLTLIQQWGSPTIAFMAILVGLASCAITSQYKSKRTEEIELLAIPPTLHPNNYNGSTSNNYSDRRGGGGGMGRGDRTVGR